MSFGSGGVARLDSQVFFVQKSVPGDKVQARVSEIKKNFSRAEVVQVLEASPQRITPPCPYQSECGGCNWQQMSYNEQLLQKQLIVQEQLNRFLNQKLELPQIIPSPQEFRYRDRVRLRVEAGQFGYSKHRSHDFLPIKDCLIAKESLVAKAFEVSSLGKMSGPVELRIDEPTGRVTAIALDEEDGQFSQANALLNTQMVETVVEAMSAFKPKVIFDLYCGDGNFSFPLLKKLRPEQFFGIEYSVSAIRKAQQQAKTLGASTKKVRFLAAAVEEALETILIPGSSSVLLDPPRGGCEEFVMKALAESAPKSIHYVSCDPSSLGRDLQRFFRLTKSNYRINKVLLFDLFPQTEHVETLVEIERYTP